MVLPSLVADQMFKAAGQLELGLGVVADAGMIPGPNQKAVEAAGCRSSSA